MSNLKSYCPRGESYKILNDEDKQLRNKKIKAYASIGKSMTTYSNTNNACIHEDRERDEKYRQAYDLIEHGIDLPEDLLSWLQDYWKNHPEEYDYTYEKYLEYEEKRKNFDSTQNLYVSKLIPVE